MNVQLNQNLSVTKMLLDVATENVPIDKTHKFEVKFIKQIGKQSLVRLVDTSSSKSSGTLTLNVSLNPNIKYIGKFIGDKLELSEKSHNSLKKSDITSKFVDFILNSEENEQNNDFLNIFGQMFFQKQENRNKINDDYKKFSQFSDNNNYYFVFNFPICGIDSKMIIKIDKLKNVVADFYLSDKPKHSDCQKITKTLKNLQNSLKIKTKSFNFGIFYDFKTFQAKISKYFSENQVDIMG